MSSGESLHRKEIWERCAKHISLPTEDASLLNDRGKSVFNGRVHWATMDLVGIGALIRPARGYMQITDFGRDLLKRYPDGFTRKDVLAMPEWAEWAKNFGQKSKPSESGILTSQSDEALTPDERLDDAIEELNNTLASELVKKIQTLKPDALEKIVLQLLRAMGYGQKDSDAEHLGGAGDEGVDGVINLDPLGLQKVYIQAKRYKDGSPITPTTVQAFIGALDSKRAAGGVFITTSDFTKAAVDAAHKSSRHIELINGPSLGKLLIEYKVGVRSIQTIDRFELDESHFEDLED